MLVGGWQAVKPALQGRAGGIHKRTRDDTNEPGNQQGKQRGNGLYLHGRFHGQSPRLDADIRIVGRIMMPRTDPLRNAIVRFAHERRQGNAPQSGYAMGRTGS